MSRLFALQRNPHGRLVLHMADGSTQEGVIPVRAFPVEAPEDGLSLIGADGREWVWIDHLDQLDTDTRALIEQELRIREFLPTIRRIRSVSGFSMPSTWQIDTDQGSTELVLKGEEDIRRLTPRSRLRISAVDGVQFQVENVTTLDKHSRKLLERFL